MMRYLFLVFFQLFLLFVYGQKPAFSKTHLVGRWVSADDPKFQLVFSDTTEQEFYDGERLSTLRYWIKSDSLVAKDNASGDVFYYAIKGLTQNYLTLIYLERGNLLKFRKQKAVNKSFRKPQ